jgi:hypothetical protein
MCLDRSGHLADLIFKRDYFSDFYYQRAQNIKVKTSAQGSSEVIKISIPIFTFILILRKLSGIIWDVQ